MTYEEKRVEIVVQAIKEANNLAAKTALQKM